MFKSFYLSKKKVLRKIYGICYNTKHYEIRHNRDLKRPYQYFSLEVSIENKRIECQRRV